MIPDDTDSVGEDDVLVRVNRLQVVEIGGEAD